MRPDLWQFCMVAETAMRSRYDLSEPFSRGQLTYATNGHIIVRVPRIAEDAEAHWPEIETVTDAISHAALSPLPRLAVPEPIECPTCRGFGVVRPHILFGDPCEGCKRCNWGYIPARKPHPDQETCDNCEGRKVVWPEREHVYLTPDCAIDPRYYLMLSALPDLRIDLTIDCVSTSWDKDQSIKGVSFAFDGGDGLVMPIRIYRPQTAATAAWVHLKGANTMASWQRLNHFEAPLCAGEACHQMGVAAAWRYESGGVGSCYCDLCRLIIERGKKYADGRVQIVSPPDDSWVRRRFINQSQ